MSFDGRVFERSLILIPRKRNSRRPAFTQSSTSLAGPLDIAFYTQLAKLLVVFISNLHYPYSLFPFALITVSPHSIYELFSVGQYYPLISLSWECLYIFHCLGTELKCLSDFWRAFHFMTNQNLLILLSWDKAWENKIPLSPSAYLFLRLIFYGKTSFLLFVFCNDVELYSSRTQHHFSLNSLSTTSWMRCKVNNDVISWWAGDSSRFIYRFLLAFSF